jgi:hypothetical protein
VLLYDKNDNVLKTATLDSDFAETSNSNFYQSIFTSSQVLQAGEIYRLVIKPNSPSQVTFFTSTFSPTELRSESMPGITDWKTTQRTTGSAWTDSDNSKPLMGLLVDGVVGGDVKSPTIPVSGADSLDEGSTYSLTLGTPTSNTVTTYRVNWGDGSVNTYSSNGVKTHVYTDGKIILSITVDLIDESGVHIAAGGKTITVNNVAPTISLSGASSVARNTVYTLTLGAISDPGTDTVFEWRIDWGDGSSNTYFDGGAKTHTYTTAGSRTITVNLVDDDGLHHNPAPGTKVITVT